MHTYKLKCVTPSEKHRAGAKYFVDRQKFLPALKALNEEHEKEEKHSLTHFQGSRRQVNLQIETIGILKVRKQS